MSLLPPEAEILDARLPYLEAQVALSGAVERKITDYYSCGWYGTTLHPDRGCYGIVNADSDLVDLVGDRVRLIHGKRSTIVYVFASYDVPEQIQITRRSYAALELLAIEPINVRMEVLTG